MKFTSFRTLIRRNLNDGAGLTIAVAAIWLQRALQMFPCFRARDLSDSRDTHIEVCGDCSDGLSRGTAFENRLNFHVVKFGERMSRPFAVPLNALQNMVSVPRILGSRAIFQILQTIVRRVPVFMVHHFARLWRANKGVHHHSMNRSGVLLNSGLGYADPQMAGSSSIHRQDPRRVVIDAIAPRRNLLHSAMRTYFIQTLETRHWKPLLGSHALEGAR